MSTTGACDPKSQRLTDSVFDITLNTVTDLEQLQQTWTNFQDRAAASFFQTWAWVGTLSAERFPNPVLLEIRRESALFGLGLFNLRKGVLGHDTLFLGESGNADLDAVYVEYNGLLTIGPPPLDLIIQCLKTAQYGPIGGRRSPRSRSVILNGVTAEYFTASRAGRQSVQIVHARPTPFVDLGSLRQLRREFLETVSANTRYQLRRSKRRYEGVGSLAIRRATSIMEAHEFLDRLARLHQDYWTRRGHPGAFANEAVVRFHRALINNAFDNDGVDLLEICAGQTVLGYLYNFKYRGHIYAYQSGFEYASPHPHCKPGLTCHYLAIELYLAESAHTYDFLAGAH